MSDTDEWEKSIQQVLLLSEDSEDRTILEMPPKRKLTVSHVNKMLEDYHGEIKSELQTLIKWILKEKHEKELRLLEKERRVKEKEKQNMEGKT
jgi:Na+/phosphate symporter